jgi:hypothetical protein
MEAAMPGDVGPARHQPVSPQNSVLLLVDQQESLLSRIYEAGRTKANLTLARCAWLLGVPAVMTTALAAGPNGSQLPELTEVFAGQQIIDRTLINAWLDRRVRDAVTRTGRAKVLIAGTGLGVCAQLPALASAAERVRLLRSRGCLRPDRARTLSRNHHPPGTSWRCVGDHPRHRPGNDGGQRPSQGQRNLHHPAGLVVTDGPR